MAAIVTLASVNVMAKSKAKKEVVPFGQLVEMIANGEHWVESKLVEIGLTKLISEVDSEIVEGADCNYFVYGKNVKIKKQDGWSVTLKSKRHHAVAIEVTLMTDNGTNLYFKDKADHDAFMDCVRKSSKYVHDGDYEAIGGSLIESDEYKDGWYVISFHMG